MKKALIYVMMAFSLVFTSLVQAADKKSTKEYIADLSSTDEQLVADAAKYLGDEEETDALDKLIEILPLQKSAKTRIAVLEALGKMDTKVKPLAAISAQIKKDESNHVVYAGLLSMLNLLLNTKEFEHADTESAIKFCEDNKKDDFLITDAVTRIRKIQAEKK